MGGEDGGGGGGYETGGVGCRLCCAYFARGYGRRTELWKDVYGVGVKVK